jgi:hypothetical protein
MAGAGRAAPTRSLQGVHRNGSALLCSCAPNEEADIPSLVDLYAKIDRMRILSWAKVVEIAERFARKIVNTYSEPNKSFVELREMINSNSVNLMREFSTACREELETLRTVTWQKRCSVMNAPPPGQARLAIVGATGMVGGYALRYALDDHAVGTVTAIVRRKLVIAHPKPKEVLHQDFSDCSPLADALSG